MASDTDSFWAYFNGFAAPRLAQRKTTFRKMFEYLDRFQAPIIIVETGCVRLLNNWEGDGQSTILFDKYVTWRGGGSRVHSVDIDERAVQLCRKMVGPNVAVSASDSVAFLNALTRKLAAEKTRVNLFYLDSFDVDFTYWVPSAAHHLKELLAAWRSVDSETLIVIDDCMISALLAANDAGNLMVIRPTSVGGKGKLVAEFAEQVGAQPLFVDYQCGWTGF